MTSLRTQSESVLSKPWRQSFKVLRLLKADFVSAFSKSEWMEQVWWVETARVKLLQRTGRLPGLAVGGVSLAVARGSQSGETRRLEFRPSPGREASRCLVPEQTAGRCPGVGGRGVLLLVRTSETQNCGVVVLEKYGQELLECLRHPGEIWRPSGLPVMSVSRESVKCGRAA